MIKKVSQKKVDSILKKIYYDLPTAGSYLGPNKWYHVLKSRGVTNIGIHTVRKWLQNQDDYSLQKPVRQTFKKARVVVSGIDDQFDVDLGDFSNISLQNGNTIFSQNDNTKFLLFVIDIFSKYLWIEPLKNKTAKEVVRGLKIIFNKGRTCKKYALITVLSSFQN
ncbi:unnamed protein product [Mytilus coruscus]|uniref:Integrase catalytic domain-containing protein n=1 Tax=Mytilus coruscus TaxID=42192 RepID=A0A6J8F0V7_MYTCO|nr:unnamed protein product [Mytilus coruscus]